MSDTKADRLPTLDECCPCRRRYKCGGYSDHVCSGPYETPCFCEEPNTQSGRDCTWPGHAAHRREVEEARDKREQEMMRAYHTTLDMLGAPPDPWPCNRAKLLARQAAAKAFQEVKQRAIYMIGQEVYVIPREWLESRTTKGE